MSNEEETLDNKNSLKQHRFNNFKILDSLDINQIVKLLEPESLQLKALILTFLPSHRARMVLDKMDSDEKTNILKRIANIKVVNLDILSRIEELFEEDVINRIRKLLTVNGISISKGLEENLAEANVGRVNEREMKFLVESFSMFQTLTSSQSILGYNLKNKSTKKRNYIYFDTKDLFLYKNNISYSLRDRDKDYFITLKVPINNDIFERDEYNASISKKDNIFDIEIHKNNSQLIPVRMVNDIIKDKPLLISAKFSVTTTRSIIELDKEHTIEISFDKIITEKTNKSNSIELYEVEIENKDAEDFVFMNFCENFKKSVGLKELNISKYQRVMNEIYNLSK